MAQRRIGKHMFVVAPLPAIRSWALQPRLVPFIVEIGRLLALFMTSESGKKIVEMVEGIDLDKMTVQQFLGMDFDLTESATLAADAAARICRQLGSKELEAVTRELLVGATCDGVQMFNATPGGGEPFDLLMQGKTLDTWRLLLFAVQINYPDVFSPRAALAAASPAAAPSAA
jgi:hypothetical protein